MEKKKQTDPLQFDKRVMHRFVGNGKMTNKELETHLQNLPDLSEQCDDIAEIVYEHSNESHGSDRDNA